MIAFDLRCANDHVFEGWFEDNEGYEEQGRKGLIACPICNGTSVTKIPSTFGIKSSGIQDGPSREQLNMAHLGKKIVEYVEKNFDDVGCEFTKEALKIHYGASPPRNIRGVSTEEEEKTLEAEGVEFFKIPMPVESDTDS